MNMKVDSTCRNKIQFVCKANMMDKQPVEKDNRGDLIDCNTFYGNGWHNSNNEPGHGHHCFKVSFYAHFHIETENLGFHR